MAAAAAEEVVGAKAVEAELAVAQGAKAAELAAAAEPGNQGNRDKSLLGNFKTSVSQHQQFIA